MRNDTDFFPQQLGRARLDVHAVHGNRSRRGVIETRDQVDHGGLARTRRTDDADGLPRGGGKADVGQRRFCALGVGQSHAVERNRSPRGVRGCGKRIVHGHSRRLCEHRFDTRRARTPLVNHDNGVCQLDQFHKNLRHIVCQREHIALCHDALVHLNCARVKQGDDAAVDNQKRERVHQRRNAPDRVLHGGLRAVRFVKPLGFLRLFPECADDPHACKVFACERGHTIQPLLHLAVKRHTAEHDGKDHRRQKRDDHHKDRCPPCVDGKSKDCRTDYDNRRAEQQAQGVVGGGLQLVDICGHAGDER